MSYNNKSIQYILEKIDERKILLPAIQRDYVWDEDQVVCLFDSVLKGFPIGSFLFWKKIANIAYEFRRDYDPDQVETDPAAPKNVKNAEYLVLDGQQRLTSLYIGFYGSYKSKKSKVDYVYYNFSTKEFSLMDENDERLQGKKWLKVSTVAEYKTIKSFRKDIEECRLIKGQAFSNPEKKNLELLYNAFAKYELSFFEISKKESLANVLDIFVRVNSGGEILSKTDLLFSSIINDWEEGRKSVKDTIDYIRKKLGKTKKIDTDFIIKNVLYMSNVDVKLKVENIQDHIDDLKNCWEDKIEAVKQMADFAYELGFHDDNIVSYNALLPISYWIYKKKGHVKKDRDPLKLFFILAQLKQLFGSGSDATLNKIQVFLKSKKVNDFPIKKISSSFDLKCSTADVDAWLKYSYKNKKAYAQLVLSLLQPKLNYLESKFHLDHLHPQAYFRMGKKCKIKKYPDEKRKKWEEMSNMVPNLQLLKGDDNQSKSDTALEDWIECDDNKVVCAPTIKSKKQRKQYYSFSNFKTFFENRKKEMRAKLIKGLKIKK